MAAPRSILRFARRQSRKPRWWLWRVLLGLSSNNYPALYLQQLVVPTKSMSESQCNGTGNAHGLSTIS